METQAKTDIYQFGEFRLDAANRLLWLGEKQVSLTPKEFEVLLALVENAGRVLTKDELLETIWTDTFVEESTLARNVSWLRKKLSTGGGTENFIETLPKRGYRFAGVVTKISESPAAVFIEERTLTRIAVEESFIVEDSAQNIAIERSPIAALPAPIESRHRYFRLPALAFGIAAAAIVFVLYQNFFRASEPKVIVASRVAPFSGLPGRENFPAFSPDGKLLAYVWNGGAGENFDVYVKQIGAGAPVRLTDTREDEVHPVFSPDGARVAFVRTFSTHSEVFLIPALGGAERKICDLRPTYSRLSFSPDGRMLAATDADEANPREGIFLIDAQTGAKRRRTSPPDSASDIAARFSPDGKTIAFLRDFGGASDDLFVVSASDAGNAAERQLTFDKTGIMGLTWNADGTKIIYASRTSALASNLHRISISGGASELIATSGKNIANPTVSADGRTLAFVEESFKTDISQIEKDAPARRLIESSGDDNSPNFSPDDSQIVFVSNRTGNFEIWIAGASGKNQRQLTDLLDSTEKGQGSPTDAPNSAGSPRFSPDGRFVAYDAQVGGNGEIFVVPANGGAARRLTHESSQEILPAWSADGQWIYFASNRGGDFSLWKIPAGGGEAVQITRGGAFESFAAPDGKTIFYTKARGTAGLWQVSVDGDGEEQAVPGLSEVGYWRYWTVTPTGVYFLAQAADSFYQIKFYDFQSRQIQTVARTEKPPIWTFPGLSASSDGKTILYAQSDQSASAIMLAELPK